MSQKRVHLAAFKAKVALAAVRGAQTLCQLSSHFAVHPTMIACGRKGCSRVCQDLFAPNRASRASASRSSCETELFEQIGRLQMELAWLEKKVPSSIEARRDLVEWGHITLSLRRQCELLGLYRSCLYFEPISESAENFMLMRLIDEQYLQTPFFGSRRMMLWLGRKVIR